MRISSSDPASRSLPAAVAPANAAVGVAASGVTEALVATPST
jgi:hypothetical protein